MTKIESFDEYTKLASRTAPQYETIEEYLANYGMGLAGEAAGEVCDLLKKICFHGHSLIENQEKLAKELGDCLWYISQLSVLLGYNLSELAYMNIEKLNNRYKGGFTVEQSINRTEKETEI